MGSGDFLNSVIESRVASDLTLNDEKQSTTVFIGAGRSLAPLSNWLGDPRGWLRGALGWASIQHPN